MQNNHDSSTPPLETHSDLEGAPVEPKPPRRKKKPPDPEDRERALAAMRKEHQYVMSRLEQIQKIGRPKSAILRVTTALQKGWLAPGSYVLQLLEANVLSLEEVLQRPRGLHQKWLGEMNSSEKSRWIALLRGVYSWKELKALLDLSPRRLQQLMKQKNVEQTSEPEPE